MDWTKLLTVLFAVGTAFLFAISERKELALWKPLAAIGVFALGCTLTSRDFDADFFPAESPAARYPVRAMKSDGAHTTFVVAEPPGDVLYFNSHRMSATNLRAQVYMRLMAHFPLLAHPQPETALLICFGVVTTRSSKK